MTDGERELTHSPKTVEFQKVPGTHLFTQELVVAIGAILDKDSVEQTRDFGRGFYTYRLTTPDVNLELTNRNERRESDIGELPNTSSVWCNNGANSAKVEGITRVLISQNGTDFVRDVPEESVIQTLHVRKDGSFNFYSELRS